MHMFKPDLYKKEYVHISFVKPGDIIWIKGDWETINDFDIKYDPFRGITIKEYSFNLGQILVERLVIDAKGNLVLN